MAFGLWVWLPFMFSVCVGQCLGNLVDGAEWRCRFFSRSGDIEAWRGLVRSVGWRLLGRCSNHGNMAIQEEVNMGATWFLEGRFPKGGPVEVAAVDHAHAAEG